MTLPKISAIVSVYDSARFLEGCLVDLERQTMVDSLEIVVINSGSPDAQDDRIVSEYMESHKNVVYVRTAWRENVYAAWNRGIAMARGEYITTANTDDRHRADAFEMMSRTLDQNRGIALVYAGFYVTERENETFDDNTALQHWLRDEYSRERLLTGDCLPGPQPMWRRSIHDEHGLFDDTYESAGDLEFWLRISQTHAFLRIPEILGLYLRRPDSIEHRDEELSRREALEILGRYRRLARKPPKPRPPG